MSFDWSGYLNLARALARDVPSPLDQEARLRSAISRAYYAAFCKARNHLRDRERCLIPRAAEVHRYVQLQFQNSTDKTRRHVGQNLDRLRIARNKADYDDAVPAVPALASTALMLAERTIAKLATL